MAPKSSSKVASAYRAMKVIGIAESTVKPVLKRLLITYEKNWELIEQENYRVLADAIFDAEDAVASELKKCSSNTEQERASNNEALLHADEEMPESQRPLKRLRRTGETSVRKPKNEGDLTGSFATEQAILSQLAYKRKVQEPVLTRDLVTTEPLPNGISQHDATGKSSLDIICSPNIFPDKGIQFSSLVLRDPVSNHAFQIKEPKIESGIVSVPMDSSTSYALLVPKDEPFTDASPQFQGPIQVIQPEANGRMTLAGSDCNDTSDRMLPGSSVHTGANTNSTFHGVETPESLRRPKTTCPPSDSSKGAMTDIEIASSSAGEVKIFFSCNEALVGPALLMHNMDEVITMVEARCMAAYKKADQNFSLKKLMKDVCDCLLELGTDLVDQRQEERTDTVTLLVDPPNNFDASQDSPDGINPISASNEATQEPCVIDASEHMSLDSHEVSRNECEDDGIMEKGFEGACSNFSGDVSQQQLQHPVVENDWVPRYAEDITKGEERVKIPWLNEVNNESPAPFQYISQSVIFHSASVRFTTYKIGDGNCCLDCYGDCSLSSGSCACAGSEYGFPYTEGGFLRDTFLEKFSPRSIESRQIPVAFCQECPLERFEGTQSCRGHLARKFIKECWIKCGCSKQCVNRSVQRGITCDLQVFFTPEGKGWGLKTLHDLPKGAFVCEYVGEILTHEEVHERNRDKSSESSMYVMLQDADWGARVLKGDETICIDAKYYGNVARFINHRCFDSNLVQIPVEVEFPDHFYYHLALFTTRNVNAFEELTLDYGTDFYQPDHDRRKLICLCGSTFCRKTLGTRRDAGKALEPLNLEL